MNEVMEQSVIGEYRLIHQLGEGGMGSVWLAEHVVLGKRFAIKFLLAENANNPDLRARFEQEARTIGRLEHPNVVSATNFGFTPDGCPYLVMEALRGQSLRGLLDQVLASTGRPLEPRRAIALIREACAGIAHAHENGVIHRDLKPDNLFVIQTITGRDQVKVLDFGIAKIRGAAGPMTHKTQTGLILGTPYYMSYEQARGETDLDFRTDIYSLAAILYELVSGARPRDGEHYNAIIADIITRDPTPLDETSLGLPPGLSALLLRGMSRVRELRYQTITEFESALGALEHSASASAAESVASGDAAARRASTRSANALATLYVPRSLALKTNTGPTAPATNVDLDGLEPKRKTTKRRGLWAAVATSLALFATTGLFLTRWLAPRTTSPAAKSELSARSMSGMAPDTGRTPEAPASPTAALTTEANAVSTTTTGTALVIPVASASVQTPSNTSTSGEVLDASLRQHDPTKHIAVSDHPANAPLPTKRTTATTGSKRAPNGSSQPEVRIKIPKNPY
jgi:serine/threonine-protein kinase